MNDKRVKYDNNSLAIICENMLTLYESGLSFVLIFDLIKDLPIKSKYKKSLLSISEKIKEGQSLEKAFYYEKGLYPDLFIGMIGIGEKNGSLSKVLDSLKKYYYKRSYIKTSIKNSLIYPGIVFVSFLILIVFITLYILPSLSAVYENSDKEVPKLFLISNSIKEIIDSKPFVAIGYLVAYILIVTIIYFLIKDNIRIKFIYNLKIMKLFYEFVCISIISIIISSGINIVLGFDQAINSLDNKYIKDKLINLKNNILKGKSLSESLNVNGGFSTYSISIIKIGEESGSVEERLSSVMNHLEKNIVKKVNELVAFVQPVSILILGGVVIIFILNYIVPIFDVIYSV